jgi:hypothetical protein
LEFLAEFFAMHPSVLPYINTPNSMQHFLTPFNVALQLYLQEPNKVERAVLYAIMDLLLTNKAKPNITTTTGQSIYDYLTDKNLMQLLIKHNWQDQPELLDPMTI